MRGREPPDPERLIDLARQGDSAARGQLLELYRGYLAILARVQISRRLQGKADESDAVQDVFLQAHRSFDQFQGQTEGELVNWLKQILVTRLSNLVRHFVGTKARDVRLERELGDEIDKSSRAMNRALIARESSPSQRAARREQSVLLAQALERLPGDYREVIILHHLEGLTIPDVARRMGRTADSVEKLWARGLARLREALGGLE
jgi:RNA polymerase sigma-70 factor (ECF subfamily)